MVFKYISCYSLSPLPVISENEINDKIQIHLMLFFIFVVAWSVTAKKLIQIHLMLFFNIFRPVHCVSYCVFKYISCYSLSGYGSTGKPKVSRFKYISCYSLSGSFKYVSIKIFYSNTSHVILYHIPGNPHPTYVSYSNTSHVILYL